MRLGSIARLVRRDNHERNPNYPAIHPDPALVRVHPGATKTAPLLLLVPGRQHAITDQKSWVSDLRADIARLYHHPWLVVVDETVGL